MEIRLRSSPGAWTCRVFLRFETDISGRPVESVREIPFGDAVTNPDAVEAILRRAQLAILNPQNSDKKFFLNLSDDEVLQAKSDPAAAGLEKQLSFSKNLICIDVTGPVTDLAFLDLPVRPSSSPHLSNCLSDHPAPRSGHHRQLGGAGRHHAHREHGSPVHHRKLLDPPHHHDAGCVELPASFIRLVGADSQLCPQTTFRTRRRSCSRRRQTRTASVRSVHFAHPHSLCRSLMLIRILTGVLTKPDTLQNGEHPSWLDLLENRRHHLSNGYFVTKQPAPEDLKKNFTYKKAREAETQFFATNEPWKSLEAGTRRHLGTAHLTSFLSDRLGRYIADK